MRVPTAGSVSSGGSAGRGAVDGGASHVDVSSLERPAALAAHFVLMFAAYYLAARVGNGFRFQNSQIGVVWPAQAVLLSSLLLTPRSRWWLVLLATALAHAVVMSPAVPAWRILWQIAGNAWFTVAMTLVLGQFAGLPLHFGNRRQVFVYTAASFVMSALFAFTAPAFVRTFLGFEHDARPATALLRVTLSNAAALLLVGPFILKWAQYGVQRLKELQPSRVLEAAVVMASLLAVGVIAFGTGPRIARFPSLLLWIVPPLLWAAVRFGPLGASTSLFCVAALSGFGTARQLGPFVLANAGDQVLALQTFWIVLYLPIMLLAAVIREREKAEDALQDQRNQLAHMTRVSTIGELSGAFAHELRQPLTAILANAQAAKQLLGRPQVDVQEVRAILEEIAAEDKVATNVIARLRTFLREGEPRFEMLALESVVHDALALARGAVDTCDVDVQTEVAARLPRINGDAVQLLQIVVNLIVNSCEAMSASRERQLRLQLAPMADQCVELTVADSGVGLPNGSEKRIFDPFFTTKGNGLGLGLSISRSIATAHGGRLWCENNARGGATFHLELPAVSASPLPR